MSDKHEIKIICPLQEDPEIAHYLRELPATTKQVWRNKNRLNWLYWLGGVLLALSTIAIAVLQGV